MPISVSIPTLLFFLPLVHTEMHGRFVDLVVLKSDFDVFRTIPQGSSIAYVIKRSAKTFSRITCFYAIL